MRCAENIKLTDRVRREHRGLSNNVGRVIISLLFYNVVTIIDMTGQVKYCLYPYVVNCVLTKPLDSSCIELSKRSWFQGKRL